MTPVEAAMLAMLVDDVRVVKRAVLAQAMFGARPWVSMLIASVCALITIVGVCRVEYTVSRLEERLERLEELRHREAAVANPPPLR